MSATLLTTFAGARLQVFISPGFAYDGSLPPWFSFHVGEYVVPPHKPVYLEPSDSVPLESSEGIELDAAKGIRVSANPHKFDSASYTMGVDKFIPVPHIGMPKAPQPPPSPLPNAHLYQEFHIPKIRRRMTAKTRKGQRRFHEWRESAFRQRKALYNAGEQLLREAEFNGDHVDRRDYCIDCGASFFERKSGKLRCRDCRWELDESTYLERQDRREFSLSDLTNDRKTNGLRPNDQQERNVWFPKWQTRFNPTNKKWPEVTAEDIEVVKGDPAFPTEVARYRVMFTGTRTNEVAEGLPNTLTKQFSRTRAEFEECTTPEEYAALCEVFGDNVDVLSLTDAQGGFDLVVAVELNNRTEWKHLGKSTDSDAKLRRALLKHREATEKARLKALRRVARANGWTDEMLAVEIQDAKERINSAYRVPLEALGQGRGTAVTYSYMGEE